MIQELVFTSARAGLQIGKSGFCTVASTPGMAENLVRLLESLSGYRHVHPAGSTSATQNPVVYSHFTSRVGGQPLHILSRIADAGLDYSNRSNKLAHHIVIPEAELADGDPIGIMRESDQFVTVWDREPEKLRPRTVAGRYLMPAPCATWQAATGDSGWAGALIEAFFARQIVYVIVRPTTPVLDLIGEALALLPAEDRWRVTFSSYFTNLPPQTECLWRFVMADSPESAAALRSPTNRVINTTQSLVAASNRFAAAARTGETIQASIPIASTPGLLEIDDSEPDLPLATPMPTAAPTSADLQLRPPDKMAPGPNQRDFGRLHRPPKMARQSERSSNKIAIRYVVVAGVGLLLTVVATTILFTEFNLSRLFADLRSSTFDKTAKEQSAIDALEKASAKNATLEKAALEKAATEKAALEKIAAEEATAERVALENAAVERAATEKAALEKNALEKAALELKESQRVADESELPISGFSTILAEIKNPDGHVIYEIFSVESPHALFTPFERFKISAFDGSRLRVLAPQESSDRNHCADLSCHARATNNSELTNDVVAQLIWTTHKQGDQTIWVLGLKDIATGPEFKDELRAIKSEYITLDYSRIELADVRSLPRLLPLSEPQFKEVEFRFPITEQSETAIMALSKLQSLQNLHRLDNYTELTSASHECEALPRGQFVLSFEQVFGESFPSEIGLFQISISLAIKVDGKAFEFEPRCVLEWSGEVNWMSEPVFQQQLENNLLAIVKAENNAEATRKIWQTAMPALLYIYSTWKPLFIEEQIQTPQLTFKSFLAQKISELKVLSSLGLKKLVERHALYSLYPTYTDMPVTSRQPKFDEKLKRKLEDAIKLALKDKWFAGWHVANGSKEIRFVVLRSASSDTKVSSLELKKWMREQWTKISEDVLKESK